MRDMQGDQRVRKAEIGRDIGVEVRDAIGIGIGMGMGIDGETIVIVIAVETGIGTASVTVGTEDATRLCHVIHTESIYARLLYPSTSHIPTFPTSSLAKAVMPNPSLPGLHCRLCR
jgi:hypothetical protein